MFGNNSVFGSAFYIVWKELGVTIDHVSEDSEHVELWISVPETSDELMADGRQNSGMVLAKRIKETLTEMGVGNLTIKAKVRKGEHWSKEKAKLAKEEAMHALYGEHKPVELEEIQ